MIYEIDLLPLQRLVQAQHRTIEHARRTYHTGMHLCSSSLSFRPEVMRRVAAEAPILTEFDRLREVNIWVPENPEPSGYDWVLRIDLIWNSYIGEQRLIFHNEFIMYTGGTLDRLLDPCLDLMVAPMPSIFPPLMHAAAQP